MTDTRYKIVVYVPTSRATEIRDVMESVGAGKIGCYNACTFSAVGVGRFRPRQGAHPTIGAVGELTAVDEERIETSAPRSLVTAVLAAVKRIHPYEQPVIDLYVLEDPTDWFKGEQLP